MAFFAKRKAQKHLSPEAHQLVHDRRLEATHRMPEWRALIEELAEYERESKEHLPSRLAQYVIPFLRVLDQDVPDGRAVTVRIDLRPSTDKSKELSQHDLDMTGTVYRKGEQHWYDDQWFSGSAALAGGSELQWGVTDRIRERVLNKRTASGKSKTKKKQKATRYIGLHLSIAADRWNPAEATPVEWMKMKTDFSGKRYDITGQVRYVVEAEDQAVELHRLLLAVSQLYRQATPAVAS
jgi:hypothetical protein